MRDGRPNPDIWGNIITCGEIAVGIYEIVGTKKRGLEIPKAVAEEILPESVMEQAAQDGEALCFTDPVSNAIVADALLEQELETDPKATARLEAIRQLDDVSYDWMKLTADAARNLFSWNSKCAATPFEISRMPAPAIQAIYTSFFIANGDYTVSVRENEDGKKVFVMDDSAGREREKIRQQFDRMLADIGAEMG